MAIEKVYITGGVGQTTFDGHTHSYRKLIQLGVDASKQFNSVVRVDVLDDAEVHVEDGTDLESVAVTVATQSTSTPV